MLKTKADKSTYGGLKWSMTSL